MAGEWEGVWRVKGRKGGREGREGGGRESDQTFPRTSHSEGMRVHRETGTLTGLIADK